MEIYLSIQGLYFKCKPPKKFCIILNLISLSPEYLFHEKTFGKKTLAESLNKLCRADSEISGKFFGLALSRSWRGRRSKKFQLPSRKWNVISASHKLLRKLLLLLFQLHIQFHQHMPRWTFPLLSPNKKLLQRKKLFVESSHVFSINKLLFEVSFRTGIYFSRKAFIWAGNFTLQLFGKKLFFPPTL